MNEEVCMWMRSSRWRKKKEEQVGTAVARAKHRESVHNRPGNADVRKRIVIDQETLCALGLCPVDVVAFNY